MQHSTKYLEILDKYDGHFLLEPSAPAGHLKRDVLSVIKSDGHPLPMQTALGFRGFVQPPREVLNDYLAAGFIAQDGQADEEGRVIYRLTDDGRKAARAV